MGWTFHNSSVFAISFFSNLMSVFLLLSTSLFSLPPSNPSPHSCFPAASFFAFLHFPFLFSPLSLWLLHLSLYIPSSHLLKYIYHPCYFPHIHPYFPLFVLLSYPIKDLGKCNIYYFLGITSQIYSFH